MAAIRKRQSKSSFIVEQHDVLGGKAKVIRTAQSGSVYQLRVWVEGEKRYLRETLKTKDLQTAINRAETRVFQIYSDVATGKKMFGIKLQEAVDKYLALRKSEVDIGRITAGRLGTVASHINHLVAYKGEDIKLSDLDRTSCFE